MFINQSKMLLNDLIIESLNETEINIIINKLYRLKDYVNNELEKINKYYLSHKKLQISDTFLINF